MKTLIIDNYDSFTYNLYHLILSVGAGSVSVVANDRIDLATIRRQAYDKIILSPGPGRPEHADDLGIGNAILAAAEWPVLGVCLGMQGLIYHYGGKIIAAPQPVHGYVDQIQHTGHGLFNDLPANFAAMRYHSLMAATPLPDCLQQTAWNADAIVMAVQHRDLPLYGVQFHPESIASEYGAKLIQNFFKATGCSTAAPKTRRQRVKPTQQTTTIPGARRLQLQVRQLTHWVDPEIIFQAWYEKSDPVYWLDSSLVRPGFSQYSFIGDCQGPLAFHCHYQQTSGTWTLTEGGKTRQCTQPALTFLRETLQGYLLDPQNQFVAGSAPYTLPFKGGLVGWLGYELKAETLSSPGHASDLPDAGFQFSDRFLAFDHLAQQLFAVALVAADRLDNTASSPDLPASAAQATTWMDSLEQQLTVLTQAPPPPPPRAGSNAAAGINPAAGLNPASAAPLRMLHSKQTYLDKILAAKQAIRSGESYELCLTNQIQTRVSADGFAIYRQLRHANQAPYAAFVRQGKLEILSSSPEQFLRVNAEGQVSSKPIKGTISRGADPIQDRKNIDFLRENSKDRAENLMIVDLLRNDLGKVCQKNSIRVPEWLQVESYATLHQLVSTVCGNIEPGKDAIDCMHAAFPGGSMTGAPKLRSVEILNQLEQNPRGIYSGALGYLSIDGSCDFSIVIRTIILHAGQARIGCGGAIIWPSDPEQEYAEMQLKAAALLAAIENAHG